MAAPGSKKLNRELRKLPGVDALLEDTRINELVGQWSQPLIVSFIRKSLADCRKKIRNGENFEGTDVLVDRIIGEAGSLTSGLLKEVINATGIIIHTNLGRAPLPKDMLGDILNISSAYSNLEFDLESGRRGKRGSALRQLIAIALGCESALVVNNNASAVFLILAGLARGKEVIVSRGELVQIGGGFRIPEILVESGAVLKEVGTTNRTSVSDYKKAISKNTALILKVHKSNFVIEGFSEEAGFAELAQLGKRKRIPLVIDIGSGLLPHPSKSGLTNEPTVSEALKSKADLVCFSGDKLLGGVQAGIIAGRKRLISKLNQNPIYRVVRPDKIVIGMLERLFLMYLKDDTNAIPIWHQIKESREELLERSKKFAASLDIPDGAVTIKEGYAYAGGGSDPGGRIDSIVIAFNNIHPGRFSSFLRSCEPPVIGRAEGGKFCIDLRTVFPRQEKTLLKLIKQAVNSS